MAQVKKLQKGGTLNINGKEYTVDQINEYLGSGQFSAQERESLAGTVRAIQEGKSRYLDTNSNSLSGDGNVNDDFADYFGSESRANRGRSGWSNKKQNRHANRNSDFAIRDEALAKLGHIGSYLSNPNTKSASNNANKLGKGSGWFYTDGKYVSGPQNVTNEKHIRNVFDYLAADEEGRKAWELSGWGDSMTGLQNWYNGQDVEELIGRIQGNKLTDEDKEVLAYMGYSPTQTDVASAQTASMRDRFKNAGYDFDKWSGIIEIDDEGNAVVRQGENGQTAFSSLGGNGNYFFNDSFVSSNPNYSFLKDHFVIDGKVYKASDAGVQGSKLYNILRSAGGFYDLNKSGDWEGADRIIKHLWNGTTNYKLGNDSNAYSQFLYDNPNIRWASITGAYDAPLSEGEQLIEYYDPNGSADPYGYGTAKWAVLDSEGRFLRNIDSRGNATGREAAALNGRKIAKTTTGNTDYDGLVEHDFVDRTGKGTGFKMYKNPITGDMIIDAGWSDGGYKMPKEIADILNKYGDTFWNNLMKNSKLQNGFFHEMAQTVRSKFNQFMKAGAYAFGDKQLIEAGISDKQDREDLMRWFKHYKKGSKDERFSERKVQRPTFQKLGGHLPKFQPGGAVGTNQTHAFTEHRLQTDYDNPENFAKIGKEELDGADYAELVGLVADSAAIGLGISGTPYAAGVAGAVGSLSSFTADVKRDGLDWKDAGNLALNLGLDVVSILPWAGAGAQSAKTVNKIRKITPTLLKVFSAWGVGDAAKMSLEKIKNGDDWTVRDVRTVLNAVAGGISLKKSGLAGGQRPKKTSNEVDIKIKGKTGKIKLTDEEIKRINSSPDKQKALADLISTKKGVKVSDIDVSGSFTPRTLLRPKTWLHKDNLNVDVVDGVVGWRKSIMDEGSDLMKWASGRGYNQAQYNEFLRTGRWKELVPDHSPVPQFTKTKPDASWKNVTEVRDAVGNVIGYRGNPTKGVKESDATSVIKKANKWDPRKLTARQREILRKAAIFTPNYLPNREDREKQLPEGFIPMSTPIVIQALEDRPRFKTGGVIKAQSGLKFSDLTPEQQQQFKDARAAAQTAGKDSFEFNGQTYGISKALPASGIKVTSSPTEANLKNDANWKQLADGSSIYNGPGEFKYSGTPEALPEQLTSGITSMGDATSNFINANNIGTTKVNVPEFVKFKEEVVEEPSLTDDLRANGYSEKLIKQQQKWQKDAAEKAASMVAGNTPGVHRGNRNVNLSNLFRAGKLINAFSADQFQRKMARNAFDSTMRGMASNSAEFYPRFQDYGVLGQYMQYANELRKPLTNVHSDVNAMYADQRTRNYKALGAELEGGLKLSQLYSDWSDKIGESQKNWAVRRMETENANRLRAASAENAYWTQMGASRAQRQNVIDNALTEQLGLYTQDRAMNYKLADQNETLRFKYDADNLKAGYQQKLNDAIASGSLAANATLEDYFAANPNEYQDYTNRMKALQQNTLNERLNNYRNYNKQSIFSAKKGGKVSNKRSASDQIWIDNQKHSAKAINQLSKQAFEFLKMALS